MLLGHFRFPWLAILAAVFTPFIIPVESWSGIVSRRDLLSGISGTLALHGIAGEASAKDWISGKPEVPRSDPSDKKGSRKDPTFLRCLGNCVSDCQQLGSGKAAPKDRAQCLAECQDGCCTTYEQCVLGICYTTLYGGFFIRLFAFCVQVLSHAKSKSRMTI